MRIIFKFIFRIIAEIIYRPQVKGKENLPKEISAILCPNHVHALDSAVIIAISKRKISCLAKEELFKNFFIRWIAKIFGIYPIKKDNKSISSIKISLKLLKSKELLMIFPEGTRKGMEKGIKPKDGAVKLAIKANSPIIPIGMQGNFKIFRKVKVNIGKPIYYNEYKDKINNKETLDKLTDDLMKEIVKLRDENI